MRTPKRFDSKCNILREYATLNPYPEQVTDLLFQVYPFFDPRDLVQVRYEMLRRVIIERQPVQATVTAFGFSRMTLHHLCKRFEAKGLVGLLPQHKCPQRASKLSTQVMDFLVEELEADSQLQPVDLQERLVKQFGVSVHADSIKRALKQYVQKKHQGRWLFSLRKRIKATMSNCVVKPWKTMATLKWHSLSDKDWQLGWSERQIARRQIPDRLMCNCVHWGRPNPRVGSSS